MLLAGCSNADPSGDLTVKWENGAISAGGKVVPYSSYKGYEATISTPNINFTFCIEETNDLTQMTVNQQAIAETDMETYQGMKGYEEFLGTKYTLCKNVGGNTWFVGQATSDDRNLTETMKAQLAAYLKDVTLTNGQVYVDFGSFKFGNTYDVVEVRPDCALIIGVAKVSQGTNELCTTPITIQQGNKEYQLVKGSSAKYDYYMYDGYLIQIAIGMDINNYITFK